MPGIRIENLKFEYYNKKTKDYITAIDGFSCNFFEHKFNVIVGSTGCGKTTLLRIIAGLEDDYEGNVFFDNVNASTLTIKKRNCTYVSQYFSLYPHLSAFDNIAFPLKLQKKKPEEIIPEVTNIADIFELTYCLSRRPKYLSGGQQQRVALARALAKDADIYLFDEPFSNIDPLKREEERRIIKKAINAIGGTVIYVTHDIKEALLLADNIIVMDEGKLIESGTPEEIYESNNPFVKDLLSATFIKD